MQKIEETDNGLEIIPILQWRDRNNQYHNFTSMTKNCNKNWPQLLNDSIEVTDHSSLPISGVRYGPMQYVSSLPIQQCFLNILAFKTVNFYILDSRIRRQLS